MVALLAMLMPFVNMLASSATSAGGFILTTSGGNADIATFTGFATAVLTWIIDAMTTVLQFLLANPLALWAIIVGAIVMVIGTLFNILKGR